MDFKTSETHKNLMRAFAGESQARNRYTFAASAAKKQQLYVIEAVFNFTANQEKEHAEIFFDHLKNLIRCIKLLQKPQSRRALRALHIHLMR